MQTVNKQQNNKKGHIQKKNMRNAFNNTNELTLQKYE